MPRVGRHPLKDKSIKIKDPEIQRVTVTTITYIPMLAGYWQESLEVLKLFFESLYAHTPQPFDLMVFDNGSCDEVKSYLADLQKQGKIQYLVFSEQNLRKLGALNFLLSAAPGEYIAYADSDVYFLPGWLEESLKILETFPEAAKVTALPIVMDTSSPIFYDVFSGPLKAGYSDPSIEIEEGIIVPDFYIDAHRVSLGETKQQYDNRINQRKDYLIRRGDCEALISGSDFQFTITQKALDQVLPLQFDAQRFGGDSIYSPILEHSLVEKGFWQISTKGYYVHHMGNKVPDLVKELPWLNLSASLNIKENIMLNQKENSGTNNQPRLINRFVNISFVRKLLKRLHTYTYRLLFEQEHKSER